MASPAPLEPDEILPPEKPGAPPPRGPQRPPPPPGAPISAFIAHWLDELFRVPGTNRRIGLDPIIALIPGLGSVASNSLGSAILLEALRHRAPFRLMIRMLGNMGANALLDAIPLLGPLLTAWFKSNLRNNDLLQRHIAHQPPPGTSPQAKLLTLFVLIALVLILLFSITVAVVLFNVVKTFLAGSWG
jgi:hypothetical protein